MTKQQLLSQVSVALAARDRAVMSLHRAILAAVDGGCSLAEIGAAMGIDRQTVRWHITKARETQETT